MRNYELANDSESEVYGNVMHTDTNKKIVFKTETNRQLKLILGCLISILILCCISTFLIITVSNLKTSKHDVGQVNEEKDSSYHILLPVQATNDTSTTVPYIKVLTTEATVFIIILISGQHTNTKISRDDGNIEVEKQLYRIRRPMKAGYSSFVHTDIQKEPQSGLKSEGFNVTHGIRVPSDGHYYVYASLQTFRTKSATKNTQITHYVQLNSKNENKTIVERSLKISKEIGVYQTSNIFLPLKLEENDVISMGVSDDTLVYNSRRCNIIGLLKQ